MQLETTQESVADTKLTRVKDICLSTPEDWKIRVRVLIKSAIKEHAKGKLFKVDFVDDLDEKTSIEAMFYTAETDHFYELVEEGATYLVSGADVAQANKRMTSVPHDFRLIFKLKTQLLKLDSTPEGQKQKQILKTAMNFTSIREILASQDKRVVNMMGRVVTDPIIEDIVSNHTNCTFKGRS